MPLEPHISKMLAEEEQPENIQRLSKFLRDNHKRSREKMGKNYATWDRNLAVFKGNYIPSEKDYEARQANEPEKAVIPLSYAQVQTFTAFGFMMYTQNENFFEYKATGDEDFDLVEVVNKIMARDLRANNYYSKIYQFLLDMARFGVAPLKSWWTIDTQTVSLITPEALQLSESGLLQGARATEEQLVKFEGNRLINVSPFRFLPDTRLPLSRWQEGKFVADEDEWHITNIKALEKSGMAAGTEFVRPLDRTSFKNRGTSRLPALEKSFDFGVSEDSSDFMVARTEGNVWLKPAEYGLGLSENEQLYTYIFANDRLVSLQTQGYLHGSFNYDLAQFSPDQEATVNAALSDTVHALQDAITFLINSRVESVRRSLDSHLVVNPQFIDMAALESRSSIIPTTKGAPMDLNTIIKQLEVKDTTSSHFSDAETLRAVMQFVTGVNENAMGQYAGGRRSATEARASNAGGASRMKVPLSMAWQSGFGSLGSKWLSNSRQGLSFDSFIKICGQSSAPLYERFAPSDIRQLVGNEDYFAFDSTLASEKGFLAQSLQELVVTMLQNPEIAAAQGFDLQKAVDEIQSLRGITNVKRFFTKPIAGGQSAPGQGMVPVPGVSA